MKMPFPFVDQQVHNMTSKFLTATKSKTQKDVINLITPRHNQTLFTEQ